MAKLGVYLFIDGNRTAVSEIQYARMKATYLSNGIPIEEDKGLFHKWMYVRSEDVQKARQNGAILDF